MELIQNSYERFHVPPQVELQREVAVEVIVPDTQADVYGVLTAFARCQVKQKTVRKDQLLVEGVVELEALCQEEEEDRWQRVRGSIPFALEVDVPGCREESTVQLRLEVLRCDAQIRNPRKLQLQAQLGLWAQLFEPQRLLVTESAGGGEEEDIQTLCAATELEVLRAVTEKKLVAADELQTGASGQLLHYTVDWRQEEQRVLFGKVMLRGSACVQAVFFQENQFLQQSYQIPFSQVLECEGLEPGDTVTVEYQTLQTQVTMLEGESAALSCNLTGAVTACVTRRMRFQVLQDLYSTRFETTCRSESLSCPAWQSFERTVPAEDTCQPQEHAVTVLDCRARARGFVDEAGRMGGIYTICVLYCCPAGRIHSAEHTMKVLCEDPVNARQLSVRAGWKDLTVRAAEGSLYIRFQAVLRGKGLVEQPCSQVIGCTLERETERALPPAGTLILRAVEDQETPWSIAKQYGTRVSRILEANRLEEGARLTPGQLMLIPYTR